MGDLVIVAYKPKPGKVEELLALSRAHVPILRALGLATDRTPIIAQAADGTVVEIFEWADGAIVTAHELPEVQAMWGRYAEVCDYIPIGDLPEAAEVFSQFVPVDSH